MEYIRRIYNYLDPEDKKRFESLVMINTLPNREENLPIDNIVELFDVTTQFVKCPSGDVSTIVIDDGVMNLVVDLTGVKILTGSIPEYENHITFTNMDDLEVIDRCFFGLDSYDFQTPIAAPGLPSIFGSYTPLDEGCKVRSMWFDNCPKLHTIDECFLDKAGKLQWIHLPTMNAIRVISAGFMCSCISLTDINLDCLYNLEIISDDFMINCRAMKTIDCSNWGRLKVIEKNFLLECRNLETINLKNLYQLRSIGSYFMSGCVSLIELACDSWYNLEQIDSFFLIDCHKIENVSLSKLYSLKRIENAFLHRCHSLKVLRLNNLPYITHVEGHRFMFGCVSLDLVDFSDWNPSFPLDTLIRHFNTDVVDIITTSLSI